MTPDPDRYEIRIRGTLSEPVLESLCAIDDIAAPAETTLHSAPVDQSGLYGLLEQLLSLGIELVEVRRLPSG